MPESVHPFAERPTVPQEYTDLINDLNNQVSTQQPEDILQFCFNFFSQRLLQERSQNRAHSFAQGKEEKYNIYDLAFLTHMSIRIIRYWNSSQRYSNGRVKSSDDSKHR